MKLKTLLILFFTNVISLHAHAQDTQEKDTTVFKWYLVQEKASFPGGDSLLDQYIFKNLKIPDVAYDSASSGTILVTFVVEKDGSLTNVEIVSKRKLGFGIEEAVLKLFRDMPKWNPAIQRDEPARMAFTKPIRLNFN